MMFGGNRWCNDDADMLLATFSGLGLSPAEIGVALMMDAAERAARPAAAHVGRDLPALAVKARRLVQSISNRMRYSGLFARRRRLSISPRRRKA